MRPFGITRKKSRGVSIIESTFIFLVLLPLFLGTAGIGINMLRSLQVIQLARDAGHMYARGVDFTAAANQQVLANVGSGLGLNTTSGTGNAVVILSKINYVDKGVCASAGKVDASGNPSGCTNYTKWVFSQRLILGNSGLRTSNFGTPSSNGTISALTQATDTHDVASISGFLPFTNTSGVIAGLPSGQVVYAAEAASTGFTMPPFAGGTPLYSYTMF